MNYNMHDSIQGVSVFIILYSHKLHICTKEEKLSKPFDFRADSFVANILLLGPEIITMVVVERNYIVTTLKICVTESCPW